MKLPLARALALLSCLAVPVAAQNGPGLAPYTDSLPGALITFEMLPVPAGRVTIPTTGGPITVDVPAFWMSRTEVTWDLYDVFAFRLDVPRDERPKIDATARPSRPYGAPDKGFGHSGYPAIGMTATAAEAFAAWLSAKTGKTYRLATEAEWQRAADVALGNAMLSKARRDAIAWSADNADAQTHPVGEKLGDQLGLKDLLGNVGEWVTTADSGHALRGGTWRDAGASLDAHTRALQAPSWNQTDPQVPKSRWWLPDAPFTGIRLVRVP